MYIQQIYTNCLAQATYYVESGNEAAIIDPLRDPAPYIELAASRGCKIKFVFETHFHADFVSGHRDLARATGATIIFGPLAEPAYTAHVANDGERIPLGQIEIEVLHTPGHTLESCCFLVHDETGKPAALFSGDTLFAGDVGRPDLLSGNLSAETLAGMLYDSLEKKIKPLSDSLPVYPGHGAGSACGKSIAQEKVTTIGEQKKVNYAMKAMSKSEFVHLVTSGQNQPPQYFFTDAILNKAGAENFEAVISNGLHKLEPDEFDHQHIAGAVIIDTRSAKRFAAAHIPGAINIGIDGDFAVWAGTLYSVGTHFLLVTEEGRERECVTRLARIGYDSILGILNGGMEAWMNVSKPVEQIQCVAPDEVEALLNSKEYTILDVRRPAESASAPLQHSTQLPLALFPTELRKLDPAARYLVCCAGGYRSMIACSLMRSMDIRHVVNLDGGVTRVLKEQPWLIETV